MRDKELDTPDEGEQLVRAVSSLGVSPTPPPLKSEEICRVKKVRRLFLALELLPFRRCRPPSDPTAAAASAIISVEEVRPWHKLLLLPSIERRVAVAGGSATKQRFDNRS